MEDKFAVDRELRELHNDRLIQEKVLKAEQEKIAFMLKNEMGSEIHDVLSGKKTVKLSKWEIFKYKINFYIDKILKVI